MEMTDAEVEKHFPVGGWRTKCGNRTWVPKKERVHDYVLLGNSEIRNSGTARGFIFGHQFACAKCGADKFSAWKGPKMPTTEKFLGINYGIQILGKEKCTCSLYQARKTS